MLIAFERIFIRKDKEILWRMPNTSANSGFNMEQTDFLKSRAENPALAPLARRMSPQTLEEYAGQEHILGTGKLLRRTIEADRLNSVIFYGPPGTGKSALARIIARTTRSHFVETNAVTIGIEDVRRIIKEATARLETEGKKTTLLLDEIHHFNKTQQDALLPHVERGLITLIGITTENPFFYVNAALISRSTLFEFKALDQKNLEGIIDRALTDEKLGLGNQKVEITKEAKEHLLKNAGGDGRRLLNALEVGALSTPRSKDGIVHFTLEVAEESLQRRALLYDKSSDEHYDHASAFIKSMRGSDPDAALYWMAKMLAAGEDPRFIARRIVICASEDVGNADPHALMLAVAALNAVEFVGMPEARIVLGQIVTYISGAPKSNAAYLGIDKAMSEVHNGPARPVPLHLRDASMDGKARGHGKGYKYPHDFPGHYTQQVYWPDPVTLYEPTEQGYEAKIRERLNARGKTVAAKTETAKKG